MEFKQGDVVQLKSGGPVMTVDSVVLGNVEKGFSPIINVCWHKEIGFCKEAFSAHALMVAACETETNRLLKEIHFKLEMININIKALKPVD